MSKSLLPALEAKQRGGTDKYGRTLARVYVNGNRISQMDVSPKSVSPKSVHTR